MTNKLPHQDKKISNRDPDKASARTLSYDSASLKLSWRIPNYPSKDKVPKLKLKRANRYLLIQNLRISQLIKDKKFKHAVTLFIGMIRTSRSYRVYAFNKWNKGGYFNLALSQVQRRFNKFESLCKGGTTKIPMTRIYIPKKNGKMRPLGIPEPSHRTYNSCWAEFIYACTEHLIQDFQHGFRKGRGAFTAGREILEKTKEPGGSIYEFDLKSFFNTVNPLSVRQILSRIDYRIADFVQLTNQRSIPKFDVRYYEEEYKTNLYEIDGISTYIVEKFGLPQGLPGSPLLCSLVLNEVGFQESNAIMYADDGLIFHKGDPLKAIFENKNFKQSNIQFAIDKCSNVGRYLKFLGITFDLEERAFVTDKGLVYAEGMSEEDLKQLVGQYYVTSGDRAQDWKGKIDDNSGVQKVAKNVGGLEELIIFVAKELLTFCGFKGYENKTSLRRHCLKLINTTTASTEACAYLMRDAKNRGAAVHKKRKMKLIIIQKIKAKKRNKKVPLDLGKLNLNQDSYTLKSPLKGMRNTEPAYAWAGDGIYLINRPSYFYKGFPVC